MMTTDTGNSCTHRRRCRRAALHEGMRIGAMLLCVGAPLAANDGPLSPGIVAPPGLHSGDWSDAVAIEVPKGPNGFAPQIANRLVEAIQDDETSDRIILSSEDFLGSRLDAVSSEGLYAEARRTAWLRNCFPSHDVEFALESHAV